VPAIPAAYLLCSTAIRQYIRAAGADNAMKARGEAISVMFGIQGSYRLRYCKREEVHFTTLL